MMSYIRLAAAPYLRDFSTIKRHYSLIQGAKDFFVKRKNALFGESDSQNNSNDESSFDSPLPYIQYPLITNAQMNKIAIDNYKFDYLHASYSFHSHHSTANIHSLSDLSDPASLNSLLPRRRPHGSPVDTLSILAGDDAMLVSPTVLGVADGVSGWESKGEHRSSGIWARSMLETLSRLLTEYKIQHMPHHLNSRDIDQVLDDSYLHTSHLMDLQNMNGSSTLILGMLSGEYLNMISIGDSKMFVIRDGAIIKTNPEQLISPLCPKQIGTQTLTQLPSEMAWLGSIKLEYGDIVVLCSDGISDNLYPDEIVGLIGDGEWRLAANRILARAKEVAFDDYAYTPFNERVNELPEKYGRSSTFGGKLDDLSICLAKVVENKREDKDKVREERKREERREREEERRRRRMFKVED